MIQINDKIRITRLDNLNMQIEVLSDIINPKTKEKRKGWKWYGYYGDLKSAINGVLKHCLMELLDEDIKNLEQLAKRIDEIDKELKENIKKLQKL